MGTTDLDRFVKEPLEIVLHFKENTYTLKHMITRKNFLNLKRRIKNSLNIKSDWESDDKQQL